MSEHKQQRGWPSKQVGTKPIAHSANAYRPRAERWCGRSSCTHRQEQERRWALRVNVVGVASLSERAHRQVVKSGDTPVWVQARVTHDEEPPLEIAVPLQHSALHEPRVLLGDPRHGYPPPNVRVEWPRRRRPRGAGRPLWDCTATSVEREEVDDLISLRWLEPRQALDVLHHVLPLHHERVGIMAPSEAASVALQVPMLDVRRAALLAQACPPALTRELFVADW